MDTLNESSGLLDVVAVLQSCASWFDFKWTEFLLAKPWMGVSDSLLEFLSSLSYDSMHAITQARQNWEGALPAEIEAVFRCQSFLEGLLSQAPVCSAPAGLPKHMSPKKSHEVWRFAAVLGDVLTDLKSPLVVDIGSGLGYLPHTISRQYAVGVVCLESKAQLCETAAQRCAPGGSGSVLTVCHTLRAHEVTACHQAIRAQLEEAGQSEEGPEMLLTGLHCCGDLSPAALHLFLSSSTFRALALVGCCYHKLSEAAQLFPLSCLVRDALTQHGMQLSPFALRLASQESGLKWARWRPEEHRQHTKQVAFRSLADLLARSPNATGDVSARAVRRASKQPDFASYLQACGFALSAAEAQAFFEEHQAGMRHIESFLFLQMLIQPLLELLILTDRAAFLREKNVSQVQLMRLFDPVLSPRCYVLIARK